MNPFKNTIALNRIRAGFRKYMKHVPAIRAAQAQDDHAKHRDSFGKRRSNS